MSEAADKTPGAPDPADKTPGAHDPADKTPGAHDPADNTHSADDAELAQLALEARKNAYAPYSKFRVGAALRTADGRVFTGANVENASYGLSVCAERSAIATAVSAGARQITAIAIATPTSPPVVPCGLCRQMLAEFARPELPVTLVNEAGEIDHSTLGELLPRAFGGADLSLPRRD